MADGWIKLHRVLMDWEWYTTQNMAHFFVYCLMKSSHKKRTWKGIELEEGQFISGRKVMAVETGLSEQSIRTCIDRLKSTNELTSQSTNEYTVFTVISWKKYQIEDAPPPPPNQPATNEQPTGNQRSTTDKKYKNENKEKNNTDCVAIPVSLSSIIGFDESWKNWLEHLKQKKTRPTVLSLKGQLAKLETSKNPIDSISKAITGNWQSIYVKDFEMKETPSFPIEPQKKKIHPRHEAGL